MFKCVLKTSKNEQTAGFYVNVKIDDFLCAPVSGFSAIFLDFMARLRLLQCGFDLTLHNSRNIDLKMFFHVKMCSKDIKQCARLWILPECEN